MKFYEILEILKDIWTSREPGEGFFGGAEGAVRFLLLVFFVCITFGIYLVVL